MPASPPSERPGRRDSLVPVLSCASTEEAATLRGVQSQGMVLAAADGDRVVLVRPDDAVAAGAVVR